ncbi:MAG TPA: DUF1801 domain-containing protein [Candidatus Nesterenkonia stercoripullorum]|uniref:DUF1801 domain-containing protein n=1 Tax=Candidatus Nesterenkonia stercoripullorum TaxID=2838701 RepID=A0A9D1UU59_9MICC|nr:DUF1801 domain-containing protein [Candidatus Nesterenkonia stercoripullorum]
MAKTHPHIEFPTGQQLAELAELVAGRADEMARLYLALHELVIATVPEVRFSVDEKDASIGYGAHQFGYNGWGMAAVTPYRRWVSLTLLDGSQLEDPQGLLIGEAVMRHVKPKALDEFEQQRDAIEGLLRAAVQLHAGQ